MDAKLLIAAAVIGVFGISGAALAREIDVDQDGKYTIGEIRSEALDLVEADYARMDINQDGKVDVYERAGARVDVPLKLAK
jgi:hypothetical protein